MKGRAMLQRSTQVSPQLVALLDERDDLRAKLSLALEDPQCDQSEIVTMRVRLAQIDGEIGDYWKGPHS